MASSVPTEAMHALAIFLEYPSRNISGSAMRVNTVAFTRVDPETAPKAVEPAIVERYKPPLRCPNHRSAARYSSLAIPPCMTRFPMKTKVGTTANA